MNQIYNFFEDFLVNLNLYSVLLIFIIAFQYDTQIIN